MVRFLLIHIGSVLAVLYIARMSIQRRVGVPKQRWLWHYASVAYLVFSNIGGLNEIYWALRHLPKGDLFGLLEQRFVVIRELPASIGVAIWVYGAIGQSIMVFLAFKLTM